MALNAKVITFQAPAGTGNSAVTGVGFQGSAIILWCTTLTANGTGAGLTLGMGFATGSSAQWAIGNNGEDNVATSNYGRAASNADIIYIPNATGSARVLEADFVSFDSDGFTLNWTTTISGAEIHALVLGGSSLTNAKVGTFTRATTTGNQAVTGVGFQGDVVLFLGSRSTTVPTDTTHCYFPIGAATSSTARWTIGAGANDNQATADSGRRLYTDNVLHLPTTTGSVSSLADFVSFDADGFTLNWSTAPAGAEHQGYLVLQGVDAKVGTITQATSTGNQATSSIGFAPAAVLFASHNSTTTGGSSIADYSVSIGAATGTTSRATAWAGDDDPADPTTTDSYTSDSLALALYDPGTPTLRAAADLASMDSDGWTLNWTTADATARVIGYLALGPASSNVTVSVPVATASAAANVPNLGTPIFRAGETATFSSGSAAVNKPTGTADGDLLVAIVNTFANGVSISAPGGWTQREQTTDANNRAFAIFTKTASSEGSSWTFTNSGSVSGRATVVAIDPNGTAVAYDDSAATMTTSSSSSHDAPDITLTRTGYVLAIAANTGTPNSPTYTAPTNTSERYETSGSGVIASHCVADYVAGAGATGTKTFTASGSIFYQAAQIAFSLVSDVTVSVPVATATAQANAPTPVVTISAPVATATAQASVPTIVYPATVAVPLSTASAAANAPTVILTSSTPAATATANAPPPTPLITVAVPVATASADALTPTVVYPATISVPLATATADANAPTVLTTIAAPVSTADAAAIAPTPGVTVAVPTATASADALAPTVVYPATIAVPLATADAAANAPTILAMVTAPTATADGAANAPTPRVTVLASVAAATADAPAPTPVYAATISVPMATATADALAPIVDTGAGGNVTVEVPAATASGQAYAPSLAVTVPVPVATADGAANAPTPVLTALAPLSEATGAASSPTPVATVPAPLATADAAAAVPTPSVTVAIPTATATGQANEPAISAPVTVAVPVATATAQAHVPTITLGEREYLDATLDVTRTLSASLRVAGVLTADLEIERVLTARMEAT